jgi:hypothetical protein
MWQFYSSDEQELRMKENEHSVSKHHEVFISRNMYSLDAMFSIGT